MVRSRADNELDASLAHPSNREYVLTALAHRCRWLTADEREEALHEAYVVLLEKHRSRQLDANRMRPHQLRAYLTRTAIHKAFDDGKRVGRSRSTPLDEGIVSAVADPRPGPAEQVEASQEGARLCQLVATLPARQRVIINLRYLFERTPAEIQLHLGITRRTYRRQLERGVRTISERYAEASP